MPSGTAFVFLLAYEIHRAEAAQIPVELIIEGRRITVYPPFRNGDGLRLDRDLSNASLPSRPGRPPAAEALPIIATPGQPEWGEPYVLADALRIDIEGATYEDRALADGVAGRLLGLLRLVTRQWWIMRGASESLAPLRGMFPIDEHGDPREGTLTGVRHVMPWLRSEALLTDEKMRIACSYLEAGVEVPLSCSTILDAAFAALHEQRGQAILLASIACEALVAEQVNDAFARGEIVKKVRRDTLKISDLRKRVDEGAREVFGRSFADENPQQAAGLERLWIARHALAHGSERQQMREQALSDRAAFWEAIFSAFALFEWMAALRPRAVPDPMAMMAAPLAR